MSFRLVAACCALSFAAALQAQSLGTAFTYQGELTEAGEPAFGLYDLQICLFDDASGATELACAPDFDDVLVQDGAFTLALDFGASPFVGEERWIELRIRPGAETGAFTVLSPRQLIRPAPEALRSNVADAATTAASAPWTGLTDVPGDFADGVDNDSGGTVTAVTAGTGLDGGTITDTGTIGIADGGVGAAQIDPAEVQQRVSGVCELGSYLRGINPDGTVICSPLFALKRFLVVPGPIGQGETPSIMIGSDGNPIISHRFYNGPSQLTVDYCSSFECSGPITKTIVDSGPNVGQFSSIAAGTDGFPVISYYDFGNANLKVAKCADVACSLPATLTTVDADPVNDVGRWTSLAVGADGLPVIAYHDNTAGALKVAKCGDAACSGSATITTVDDGAGNDVGDSLSLAIGADGLPVIAYYDTTGGALKVAHCVDPSCTASATITTLDDGSGHNVGIYPSIAIGDDGFPVISYHDRIFAALAVAKCSDVACSGAVTYTVVDDPADNAAVGEYTSIEISSGGLPVISYYDRSRSDPKFLRCAAPDCSGPGNTSVGLPNGNVSEGLQTSLALIQEGLPVIAHWSNQENSLRLVICGTLSCQ